MRSQSDSRSEGEILHARHRARFWKLIGALGLVGIVGGIVGGYVRSHEGADTVGTGIGVAGVALAVALMVYGTWKFFRTVDEVEVVDNLWASLIGFYVYAIMLPAWWALDKLGVAPEPNHWAIYATTITIAGFAYFYRKFASR